MPPKGDPRVESYVKGNASATKTTDEELIQPVGSVSSSISDASTADPMTSGVMTSKTTAGMRSNRASNPSQDTPPRQSTNTMTSESHPPSRRSRTNPLSTDWKIPQDDFQYELRHARVQDLSDKLRTALGQDFSDKLRKTKGYDPLVVTSSSISSSALWMGVSLVVAVVFYLYQVKTKKAVDPPSDQEKNKIRQQRLINLQHRQPQPEKSYAHVSSSVSETEQGERGAVASSLHANLQLKPRSKNEKSEADGTIDTQSSIATLVALKASQTLVKDMDNSSTSKGDVKLSSSATAPTTLHQPVSPPVQLLCLTLSELFSLEVCVQTNVDAGSWGGQDWRLLPKGRHSTKGTLTLDLQNYYQKYKTSQYGAADHVDQSWTSLLDVLRHIFSPGRVGAIGPVSSWSTTLHILPSVVTSGIKTKKDWEDVTWLRLVLSYHTRFTDMVRHKKYPTVVKLWMENNHKVKTSSSLENGVYTPSSLLVKPLVDCLDIIRSWLMHHFVREVKPFLCEMAEDPDDIKEPSLELFSDEYGMDCKRACTRSSAPLYMQLTSPLDLLPSLLESSSRLNSTDDFVTTEFVEEYLLQLQLLLSEATFKCTHASTAADPKLTHKKTAPKNSTAVAARMLLQQCFDRVDTALHTPHHFNHTVLSARILAISSLLALSPSICAIIPHALCGDTSLLDDKRSRHNGRSLRALWEAAAYVVPAVGSERFGSSDPTVITPFYQHLDVVDDFPLILFQQDESPVFRGSKPKRKELNRVLDESYFVMNQARTTVKSLLRVAFKYGDKRNVFRWMGGIIRQHESLVSLINTQVLDTDLKSSRQFLLGFSSSLICYCHTSLSKRLEKKGATAFDLEFIRNDFQGCYFQPMNDTNRLFQGCTQHKVKACEKNSQENFDGATWFFFLTSLCLRVAIRTAFRTENQLHRQNESVISFLQNGANSSIRGISPAQLTAFKPFMSAYIGWLVYLRDADSVNAITEVSLVQLGWLVDIAAGANRYDLSLVPDWMCREPARWITYTADRVPHLLKPAQADRAVAYATQLLELGVSVGSSKSRSCFSFSPIVNSALIDIISSFVQTSARKAKQKAKAQQSKTRLATASNLGNNDVDIYSSFQRNDSGVTVFTNEVVRQKLCPALIRTFEDTGTVEGYDMEKDDAFSKHGERTKIARLICQLWYHPSGKFRESFAVISEKDLFVFGSSVSKSLANDLNFGLEALTKLFMRKKQIVGMNATRGVPHGTGRWISMGCTMLLSARRYLWLLCSLSHDERIASCLGGSVDCFDREQFATISGLLLHVLDVLTTSEGGTKESLEGMNADPTSKYLDQKLFLSLSKNEKKDLIHKVVRRRIISRVEYGLDVSNLCHVLFALFARWHFAAAKETELGRRTSPLVEAVAENEDWDQARAISVFERLVVEHEVVDGNELDNYEAILQSDGHVDHRRWENNYIESEIPDERRKYRDIAAEDQIKRSSIDEVASIQLIRTFLADLVAASPDRASKHRTEITKIPDLEKVLFSLDNNIVDEDIYAKKLSEWQVSSDSFASRDGNSFLHYFGKVARNRGLTGSGKTLVKEARRCKKLLPDPSPNSSIYICFAEERMDLCRAVLSGPVDTPYAHGLFVFDVYFPPSYPSTPPMVTFMTTGGGRVRFNPNLYVDGKVCISLLGGAEALAESQRWDKDQSSLAQVLLSIQSQILGVDEPYYNEGNGVPLHLKGTREGNAGSQAYNRDVRLGTLRHAMIDMLRCPPLGFEEVVYRHFALCRQRVAMQSKRWMTEALIQAQQSKSQEDKVVHSRFAQLHADLLTLLMENPLAQESASLKPLEADVKVVAMFDSSVQRFLAKPKEKDKKLPAKDAGRQNDRDERRRELTTDSAQGQNGYQRQRAELNNPWAFPVPIEESSNDPVERNSSGYTSDGDLYD